MIKVLFVINSLAPGGTETSTLLMIPPLKALGVHTTVVTLGVARDDLIDEARAAGTDVIQVGAAGRVGQLRQVRQLISERRPDVVHTALFDADIVGRVAAWGTGVPVVSSLVSTPYDRARLDDPNVVRWKLEVVRLLDAVTGRFLVRCFHSVSGGVKAANARALHLPLDRIAVAERGRPVNMRSFSDEERFSLRRELGVVDQQVLLLNIGRQEYSKAQAELVGAMGWLVRTGIDPVLAIAGREGNATDLLRSSIEAAGEIGGRIRVLGHRTDVPELLNAADVLVISSRLEGTAGVALEAMAYGTPVVSTRLEGLAGVLDHGRNALLVEPGDMQALVDAVAIVANEPELADRLAAEGRSDYQTRFTLEAGADRMAKLYANVIGRQPTPTADSMQE